MDENNITQSKIEEVKPIVKLFGLDYDGTVSDGDKFKLPEVITLVEKILDNNKSVAFITARGITALTTIAESLKEMILEKNLLKSVYMALGNGTTLYEINNRGLAEIYSYRFNLPQVLRAAEIGQATYKKLGIKREDLSAKGLETFQKFLKEDWSRYIPKKIFNVCRIGNGEFFTEEIKVTFVLPKVKSLHKKIISELNDKLDGDMLASAGDDTFLHITRKLKDDGKKVAIKKILEILDINEAEVATFGDMPNGNDAGLLSFSYSFTNSEEFANIQNNHEIPPYILADLKLPPVARVHKAIEYLIK